MAVQMLALHWKAARWGVLLFSVAAFALPLLVVQGLGGITSAGAPGDFALQAITAAMAWTPLFPVLAVAGGATVALTAWAWDHRGDHVYALSLPVARWRYAGLKFAGGAVILLVPVLTLALGATLASASVEIPAGLRAYPVALTMKFLAASLTAYALMFALAAGTIRTATVLIVTAMVVIVLGNPAVDFAADLFPALEGVRFSEVVLDRLTRWPSPFQVFGGNWLLFDV